MEKYDIELTGNEQFVRKYDYLPYTYNRIVTILREYFGAELVDLCTGYKQTRYIQKKRYNVVKIDTKEIIYENIYLDDLMRVFANRRIPMRKGE